MNDYRFPENRITKAAIGLYLFLLLYLCRDSMFGMYVVGFYPSQAITLALTAVLGLAFLWHQRGNWKQVFRDGRMVMVLTVTAVMLVPMVLKQDWQMMYLSILFCLLIPVFLTFFLTWREAATYYVLMMTALGVYSIFTAYLFRIPLDRGVIAAEVFRDGRNEEIYNFVFSIVPRYFVTNRNFGMFREPGVYQYFILLALFLTHYGVTWKKAWCKWTVTALLCLTMITTFATGGVAEMGLLALFVFFDQKLYRNRAILAVALVLVLVLCAFLYYCYETRNVIWQEIYLMVFNKFLKQEDSVTERTEAILVNLEMMAQHPLVGEKLASVLHAVQNNTSSTLILFAGWGLFSGIFHVLAWAALVWKKERRVIGNLVLMGILFLSFNTQNLTWDVYFWLFPVMALTETCVPVIEERRRKGIA